MNEEPQINRHRGPPDWLEDAVDQHPRFDQSVNQCLIDTLPGVLVLVLLAVVVAPLGDFNKDAIVNAADYVVWRNGLGTDYFESDYEVWRSHFGQAAGSGVAIPSVAPLSSVPEPATFALILTIALFAPCRDCYLHRRVST